LSRTLTITASARTSTPAKGKIIDGRNRALACQKLGIEPKYHERRFTDKAGLRAYIISQNIHRRHLTAEQKRDLIGKLLKATPEKSDRQIAKQARVDNKTVATVRKEKEAREEIPHVKTRTDTKGRKQSASKTKRLAAWKRKVEAISSKQEAETKPHKPQPMPGEIGPTLLPGTLSSDGFERELRGAEVVVAEVKGEQAVVKASNLITAWEGADYAERFGFITAKLRDIFSFASDEQRELLRIFLDGRMH
jgi:hypothetical protein